MMVNQRLFCADHRRLLDTLAQTRELLLIQDLDGVCMELVGDPLERTLDPAYLEAAARLDGSFYVLTNGEHAGARGVNAIVDRSCADAATRRYLPGLAAGGVQWQRHDGVVSHPGVDARELAFLAEVPRRATEYLRGVLAATPYCVRGDAIETLLASVVLDNAVSPTVNANRLHRHFADAPALYQQLQGELVALMEQLLAEARTAGLGDAFFIHYAPNLGRDPQGGERWKPASAADAGTTDFQFMLDGAVKEVGVLVLLNHHYHRRTGAWPLGETFNARTAPRDADALRALARDHFDPALMPCIVGIGDTVTSIGGDAGTWLRGGSDRGFLQLVQGLGKDFASGNLVLYVDSSGGEVRRPGIDQSALQRHWDDPCQPPWPALAGITDADDPLRLDYVFPGGHRQYVAFFRELARRRSAG